MISRHQDGLGGTHQAATVPHATGPAQVLTVGRAALAGNRIRLPARALIQVQTVVQAVTAACFTTTGIATSQAYVPREPILPTVVVEDTAIVADTPTMEVSE